MDSPKIVYKYYSNPAFCAQSEVIFAQKSCVSKIVSPDRRMPPLGANSPIKAEVGNRIVRTDISDNPLRISPAGRNRDEPPELPPKPIKYQNRSFQRQASLMCKPSRSMVRSRTRSEDLEMAQFKQNRSKYDRNADSDDGLEDSRIKHRYEIIQDLDDIVDYSPTKKRIVEADASEIDEYNVDGPDDHEMKEIPTEIVKTVNGKTLRYAIVSSDDEDKKVTFTSPMMSKKHLIATQKLHELLSTPRKLKSYGSQPSVRITPSKVDSPRYPGTPMKMTSTPTRGVTPSKSCANLTLNRSNATSPISPKAQQKLNYGLPEFEKPDVFVTSVNKSRDRSFDERRDDRVSRDRVYDTRRVRESQRNLRDKNTAVIIPRVAPQSPSIYSEDTYQSFSRLKGGSPAACLTVAALTLTLCGALASSLSLYIMYAIGRRYYLDFGVFSGFTCFLLGLLGVRKRRRQLLPNRNFVSGYIVLSSFSLISAFGLLLLLIVHSAVGYIVLSSFSLISAFGLLLLLVARPEAGTPLSDVTSGAVCGVSALCLALAAVGALASYCCAADPPDNRVDTAQWY